MYDKHNKNQWKPRITPLRKFIVLYTAYLCQMKMDYI